MAITLTDPQWEKIRGHFPEENVPDGRPGRKAIPTRRVLDACAPQKVDPI
jgi:transposase